MKWFTNLCLFFVYLDASVAINDNYNFTYSMASRCKQYISRRGYNYNSFYHIDENTLQHTTVKKENSEQEISYFEMHIAIQAASNGHILLSPVPHPGPAQRVYEIVVGGGGNRFTELRLNLKRNAKGSAKTPKILSTVEFTAFYIKVSDDGQVEFGKEGDSLPLVSYYDPDPLQIKYFSFASWAGVEAKFLYDCPTSAEEEITPDSQLIEPKLSVSDSLKRSLLLSKLPSVPPSPTMQVQLGITITHVKYNALDSRLLTRLAVVMSWTDNSMAWSPTKFNGTTSLKLRQGQIWRPTFFVFNSDNINPLDTSNPDLISVVYNGDATFHFQTEITSWCMDTESGLNKWPRDQYDCSIVIEPWEVHEKIMIEIMDPKDHKMAVFADIDKMVVSEWEVIYTPMVIKPDLWNIVYANDDNQTHQSTRYVINMSLTRNATCYNIVFYTPLLVLLTFVLMSFWNDPLELSRVWFYAGCAAIICMGLSNIDFMVPTHTVPSILVLYTTLLGGVLLALLVKVLLMTSVAEKLCKTSFMQGVLTFSLLRFVFCLPPVKLSFSGGYTQQDDDDEEGCAPDGSVEEMESDTKTYGGKADLAEVLDKMMFFVYSITAAIMLAAHY